MLSGYKCFNKGLVNKYGEVFEIGKVYHVNGDIKFHKNGFHMCTNLEDTLRYFDAFNEEVDITSVIGYGNINKYDDEYNEFFDMYSVEYLKLLTLLKREEIISYALKLPSMRLKRFISLFRLTKEELELFREKFNKDSMIQTTIDYYQDEKSKLYIKKKGIV